MQRNPLLGWTSKNIILPFVPFAFGTVARLFLKEPLDTRVLDSGDLSITMAMLCLLVALSAMRLDDKSLADTLTALSFTSAGLFVVFFVLAIAFGELSAAYPAASYATKAEIVRWLVVVLSILVVWLAIEAKHRYFPLED